MAGDDTDRRDVPEIVRNLQARKRRHKQRGLLYRGAVVVGGGLLVLIGIVLSGPGVPGPGFAVILVGLAMLALEFDRAERLLEWVIVKADDAKRWVARMPVAQKTAAAFAGLLILAGAVFAALTWDIPLLPV